MIKYETPEMDITIFSGDDILTDAITQSEFVTGPVVDDPMPGLPELPGIE